jgi:hypothetical protein
MSYNSFLDRAEMNSEGIVTPDPEVAEEAWKTIESLNLPKKCFEFAKLFYRDGKTAPQTASALKLSAQACHNRHTKLKREIRERFERLEVWKKHEDKVENMSLKHQVVIELFYNVLFDRIEISKMINVHYTQVADILRQFQKKYLDK